MNNFFEQNRSFKGIFIPKDLWFNQKLSGMERVLLAEIDSLDNGEKGCYASNKYFADFMMLTERQISRYISHLEELGFIKVTMTSGNKRTIKVSQNVYQPWTSMSTTDRHRCLDNNIDNKIDINNAPSQDDDALSEDEISEEFLANKATIKANKDKFEADVRYNFPNSKGLYDWRYILNRGKGLTPWKLFIAYYWKQKEELSKGVYTYQFKNKAQAAATMMQEAKWAKQLCRMMTVKEFIKAMEEVDAEAFDERTMTYRYDWKLSTLLKNLHRGQQ